ncbi:MAG: VOC family protein, partial [Gluconacetobacter diazotrophicus]|nr:VOC family protein [Gluconacetobacter diazotrophicus]
MVARAAGARSADPDVLRARFSAGLSEMYRREVPLYGTLIELVAAVNGRAGGTADPRLEVERHGAIRLGTEAELRLVARVFGAMGMRAVGYYDLAAAGVPVHSTAFRPVEAAAFARSPFRVFTSLLRPELIADPALREEAKAILSRRRIGSEELDALLERAEREGGVPEEDAERFVAAAATVFRWHETAPVTLELYQRLRAAHPLVADVVCFRGPHLNHLTPRTLDIDAAQDAMRDAGMTPKATIEGPPRRRVPILLRQTSFQALTERVRFGDGRDGAHTARFGEIEARGAALTPAGRALYDRLLAQVDAAVAAGEERGAALRDTFAAFPDDEHALRERELAFFGARSGRPLVYEDFLPVSAAGIFRSNLGGDGAKESGMAAGSRTAFEAA